MTGGIREFYCRSPVIYVAAQRMSHQAPPPAGDRDTWAAASYVLLNGARALTGLGHCDDALACLNAARMIAQQVRCLVPFAVIASSPSSR